MCLLQKDPLQYGHTASWGLSLKVFAAVQETQYSTNIQTTWTWVACVSGLWSVGTACAVCAIWSSTSGYSCFENCSYTVCCIQCTVNEVQYI